MLNDVTDSFHSEHFPISVALVDAFVELKLYACGTSGNGRRPSSASPVTSGRDGGPFRLEMLYGGSFPGSCYTIIIIKEPPTPYSND